MIHARALPAVGSAPWAGGVVCALGCLALAGRRVESWAVGITLLVGLAGLGLPAAERHPQARAWLGAVGVGAAAFAAVRWGWSAPAIPLALVPLVSSVAAAVAQEAFFRRGMYAWLERWGAAVAIGGTALAFSLVHVPMYGWGVFGLNVAAGLVFGWQRWATGSWSAPAVTHVFANVIQMGW